MALPPIPEDLQREIIRLYKSGKTVNAISLLPGMPARSSIRKYIGQNELREEMEAAAAMSVAPELIAKPAGTCPVSGAKLFLVVDNEHTHLVPEAIVKAASGRKWKVAA